MIKEYWQRFHTWVNGAPSGIITLLLIATSIFGLIVALNAPAEFKVLLLAWWWFP